MLKALTFISTLHSQITFHKHRTIYETRELMTQFIYKQPQALSVRIILYFQSAGYPPSS